VDVRGELLTKGEEGTEMERIGDILMYSAGVLIFSLWLIAWGLSMEMHTLANKIVAAIDRLTEVEKNLYEDNSDNL